MSMFAKLNTEGLEESTDRLGGFAAKETDIYLATIKAMYAQPSGSGALGVTLIATLEDGSEYRETMYVTNKKGENFFLNKNDKTKKVPLPGFVTVEDICLIASGKPLSEQETEEKVLNIYDSEARKELPKSVPCLVDVMGKQVALGIVKQVVNKNVKQGNEYVPTAETREENVIDKIFHPEVKLTVAEARAGKETAEFWDAWLEKNKGQTRDRTVAAAGAERGAPPKPGAAPAAGQTSVAPRQSLFGKK